MATAGATGADSAATASADAAASGAIGGLAETFASAAATSVAGTASVMAKAAAKSKARGPAQWEAFAKSQVCVRMLKPAGALRTFTSCGPEGTSALQLSLLFGSHCCSGLFAAPKSCQPGMAWGYEV